MSSFPAPQLSFFLVVLSSVPHLYTFETFTSQHSSPLSKTSLRGILLHLVTQSATTTSPRSFLTAHATPSRPRQPDASTTSSPTIPAAPKSTTPSAQPHRTTPPPPPLPRMGCSASLPTSTTTSPSSRRPAPYTRVSGPLTHFSESRYYTSRPATPSPRSTSRQRPDGGRRRGSTNRPTPMPPVPVGTTGTVEWRRRSRARRRTRTRVRGGV